MGVDRYSHQFLPWNMICSYIHHSSVVNFVKIDRSAEECASQYKMILYNMLSCNDNDVFFPSKDLG